MSDEGKPLTGEYVLKSLIWRSVIGIGGSMEQFTTWTVTGVGAIIALLVGNLDAVSKALNPAGLKWSLVMLTLSVVVGAISKQFGMALSKGLETVQRIEGLLHSDARLNLVKAVTVDTRTLNREVAEAFWWPLSSLMQRACESGAADYCSGDKRLVNLWCWQLFTNSIHGVLGAAGIIALAFNLK